MVGQVLQKSLASIDNSNAYNDILLCVCVGGGVFRSPFPSEWMLELGWRVGGCKCYPYSDQGPIGRNTMIINAQSQD